MTNLRFGMWKRVAVAVITGVLAGTLQAANQWWDTATNSGLTPGSTAWDTAISAWATNASPGTNAPVAWVDGNSAWFSTGNSTATVNGVTANILTFSSGNYLFQPGSGPLAITGAITNISGSQTFNTPIALGANQDWLTYGNNWLYFNGAVTGAFTASIWQNGNAAVTLTNTANQVAGVTVKGGTLRVDNGGNVLGGSSSTLTLGMTNGQLTVAAVSIKPAVAGVYSYTIGDLNVAGAANINFDSYGSSIYATNTLNFGTLTRTGKGTLFINGSGNPYHGLGFAGGNLHAMTFSSLPGMVNGILPPWIVNARGAAPDRFVTVVGGSLVENTATVAQGGFWNAATNVEMTGDFSLTGNTNVNSIVVGNKSLTVGSGLTLANTSGGFLLNGGKILGAGTLDVGANEMLVYVTGANTITPAISGSGGLTMFGGGTLTLSNAMTYAGTTWINGGTLNVYEDGTRNWSEPISGAGGLQKSGPGTLSLNQTTNSLYGLTVSGGTLALNGGRLNNPGAVSFGARDTSLVISNGCKAFMNLWPFSATITVGGISNALRIVGSGAPGDGTVLDIRNKGPLLDLQIGGAASSTGSSVVVDGQGYAGGAVISNVGYRFFVTGGSGASLMVTNGGTILQPYFGNNYSSFSVGDGNNNRIVVGGGSAVSTVSNITYYGLVIGGTDTAKPGTNNTVTLDTNALFYTSAVNIYGTNSVLTVNAAATLMGGYNGGAGRNFTVNGVSNLVAVNGGVVNLTNTTVASVTVGAGATDRNNQMIVSNATMSSGPLVVGLGGNSNSVLIAQGTIWNLYNNLLGVGVNGYNTLTIDGATVTNHSGNEYVGNGASASGNRLIIRNGGRLIKGTGAADIYVGGLVTGSSNNLMQVGGPGAPSYASMRNLTIGGNGAMANHGNQVVVTNGTVESGNNLSIGQAGTNNSMLVLAGGYWNAGGTIMVGAQAGGSGNWLLVNAGVVSNGAADTYLGNGANANNNTLAITNGGSFSSRALVAGNNATALGNVCRVSSGGTLEAAGNGLVTGAGAGNLITNSGGVYQFTSATPTITTNGAAGGSIFLDAGVIAFRAVTTADVKNNWSGTTLARITYTGANAFRLNNATNNSGTAGAQSYWFDTGRGATNYAGLEMFNGGTAYTNGSVTIGTNGWLTYSNTTAVMWGAVTNFGIMRLIRSTVTFKSGLALAEGCRIVCDTNSSATVVGTLALPVNATLTVDGLDKKNSMTLFTATTVTGSATSWSVEPVSFKVKVSGNTVSIVPRQVGTLISVQ